MEQWIPWSVGKVSYKRGGKVGTSSIDVGINTSGLGYPYYFSPPPHPHLLFLETSLQFSFSSTTTTSSSSASSSRPVVPVVTASTSLVFIWLVCLALLLYLSSSLPSLFLSPLSHPTVAILPTTAVKPLRMTQFSHHSLQLCPLCLRHHCKIILITVGGVTLTSSYQILLPS